MTLISKYDDSNRLSQYRSIALCNVIYKVVTKIISQRLMVIMTKVVSVSQSSFVPRRHTTYNAISLQELIHCMQNLKGRLGFMIINLDLEKAYDMVKWSFVEKMLVHFGIPLWMVSFIVTCISSSAMSINWNGNGTDLFSPSAGTPARRSFVSLLVWVMFRKVDPLH